MTGQLDPLQYPFRYLKPSRQRRPSRRRPSLGAGAMACANLRPAGLGPIRCRPRCRPEGRTPRSPPPAPAQRQTPPGTAAEHERLGSLALAASAPRSLTQCLPPRSPLPSLAHKPLAQFYVRSLAARVYLRYQATPTPSCGHVVATRRYRQADVASTWRRCLVKSCPTNDEAPTPPHLAADPTCNAPAPHLRRSWEVGRTAATPCPPIRPIPALRPGESVPTPGRS